MKHGVYRKSTKSAVKYLSKSWLNGMQILATATHKYETVHEPEAEWQSPSSYTTVQTPY